MTYIFVIKKSKNKSHLLLFDSAESFLFGSQYDGKYEINEIHFDELKSFFD